MRSKLLAILLVLSTALLLISCGGGQMHDARLQGLDSLVETSPDSALAVMSHIDGSLLRRSDRMYLELLRAKAMNKAFVDFTTDSVLLEVNDYYDSYGTPNQQMLAHYLLGCAYRDLGSAPKAIDAYLEVLNRVDTTNSDFDYRLLSRVYSQTANLYSMLKIPSYEEDALTKAIALCIRIGDIQSLEILEEKKCHLLLASKRYDKCIDTAYKMYRKRLVENNSNGAYIACVYLSKSYMGKHEYDSAKICLDEYTKAFNSPSFDPRTIYAEYSALDILKGEYFLQVGQLDSAMVCYRHVLGSSVKNEYLGQVLAGMARLYQEKGKPDSLLKYALMFDTLNNSAYNKFTAEYCIRAKELYDYGIEQKIANRKSEEAAIAKTRLYFALIAMSILLVLVFYIRFRHQQAKAESANLRLKHQLAINKLHDTESHLRILSFQKQEIEDILNDETEKSEHYKRELLNIRQEICEKTDEMDELRKQVHKLEKVISSDTHTNTEEQLLQSDIVAQFRMSFTSKGYHIGLAQWTQLHETIAALYPGFDETINADGKLSKSDLQVCMLVKAGFTPSEIDYLMQMKHSYATNARKRLHLAIFGSPGSGEEFDKKIRYIQ